LARRLQEKRVFKRRLYALGYTPEQVRLPDALRTQFAQELRTFEEER
jgi:hypothetical protein